MPFSRAGLGPLAVVRQPPRSLTIAADAHSSQIKRTARTRLKGGGGMRRGAHRPLDSRMVSPRETSVARPSS
jgi:hypothetical protein